MDAVRGRSPRRAGCLALVLAAVAVLPATASAASYSDTCTSPGAKVADGYAGASTYVTLRAQPKPGDPGTTWICYRVANGTSLSAGGRFDVATGSANPGVPSVDTNSTACSTSSGNVLPPPHPFLAGFAGPVTFSFDAYASPAGAWLCMETTGPTVGELKRRVIVPGGGVTAPSLVNNQDAPAPPLPPPPPGPGGYPSSSCQSGAFGSSTPLINAEAGAAHGWLYTAQPSANKLHVCARITGPVTAGGMLTVDQTGSPGVGLFRETSTTDVTPCTLPLAGTTNPVVAQLAVSPVGANPASVCVAVGDTKQRVTVGTTGSPVVRPPTWTPDPDSAL